MNSKRIEGGLLSSFMSFNHIRLGEWLIKLSAIAREEHFVMIAIHTRSHECIVRAFTDEEDLAMYVNYIYVKGTE